jgi:hypothetical protein
MRIRLRPAAFAAVGLTSSALVLGLSSPGPASAATTGGPQPVLAATEHHTVSALAADPHIDALSLSSAEVTASGVALGQVTVTTTVTNWPGGDHPDLAVLTRTSPGAPGAPESMVAPLQRTSGVPGSGTYQGVVPVPSTATGTWRVSEVRDAFMLEMDYFTRDPRQDGVPDALLTVHGTHLPRLRLSVQPPILPYPQTKYTVTALFTTDTGAPLAGRRIGFDELPTEACKLGNRGVPTDARGRAFHAITWEGRWGVCVWAPLPNAPDYPGTGFASGLVGGRYAVKLGAAPASTSVKRGTSVPVNGNVVAVRPPAGTHVRLQRLVDRTWRNVNIANVHLSGRFHLVATPPDRGRNTYRVWFPSRGPFVGTVTRSILISTG